MWDNYVIVARLDNEAADYKKALFLHILGPDGLLIYNGMKLGDNHTLEDIIEALENHFTGKINETYERFVFNKRYQKSNEPFEDYVATLRTLMKTCNFSDDMKDSQLRDRIVLGIRNQSTRERLLQEAELTLQACIDKCRAAETTTQQLRAMSENELAAEAHAISARPRKGSSGVKKASCKFCGQTHILKKEECPAWGKTCKNCKTKNHFAVKCQQKKKLHAVQESESESDDEQLLSVGQERKDKIIKAEMIIEGKKVTCQVDSGASVNVISSRHIKRSKLQECRTKLHVYNGSTIKAQGKTQLHLTNPKTGHHFKADFVVVRGDFTTLLGKKTSEDVGLITVHYQNFESISKIEDSTDILSSYADVFSDDQGSLPGIAHFQIDETVTPVITPPCRIPHAMKKKVKAELEKLTDADVVTPVEEPTSWCSRMVVATKKSGNLRICIDPRPLNKALKREHYPPPVMDDILPKLAGSKVFSKLDLSNAYWHVHLDEESSMLTTFQTPYGRYLWKRLPFGTSVSSELFQKHLDQALEGLQGVIGVSDDVIVHGKDAEDHDKNLTSLLEKCRTLGIKLNKDKAELRKTQISFLGHLVTKDGLQIYPEKLEAVREMPKPQDVEGVRRFCGFVNYLAKFLPKLSEVLEPIRQLTREDTTWIWTPTHDKAFETVQKLVTEAPVLAFYNPEEELTIQCDASQSGLGAVLLQSDRPVAYASRALTDPETRYAQIEKELLAIVFSVEKFHQYTFGRPVKVQSDHKPLEAILQKPLSSAPKRLQGMMLRLQGYDISVTYKKGKEMLLADTLSRGWPDEKSSLPMEVTPYHSFRDELSVQDGLIIKQDRVVIPFSMRSEIKQLLHSTHSGIDACLKRARECLYWPGMTGDIKQYISACEICQSYQSSNQPESLQPHELPSRQWEKIGVHLFKLEGKDYMVTVDYLSNYWEIDRLENTKAPTVVRKLKAHFARYGSPCVLISDNGLQFTSEKVKQFATTFDFEHRTSSPYDSKSNGKAESAVKTAKSILRKNKDGDQFLALLNYRNTPSQSIGTSPAQRFFNRRTRTLLPTCETLLKPKLSLESDIQKLHSNQKKQKKNFDRRAKDLPPLEEGDAVVMQPHTHGKKKWSRATVISGSGRSYNVEAEDGAIYRRNRVHLKKIADQAPAPQPGSRQPTSMAQYYVRHGGDRPARPAGDRPARPAGDRPVCPASDRPVRPAGDRPVCPAGDSPVRPADDCPHRTLAPAVTPRAASPPDRSSPDGPKTSPSQKTRTGSTSPVSPSRIPIRTRSGREIRHNQKKDFVY